MTVQPSFDDDGPAAADSLVLADAVPLVGRDHELTGLMQLLEPGGAAVVDVTGAPGIGKSALVRAALERVASRFLEVQRMDLAGDTAASALSGLRHHVSRLPVPLHRGDARWAGQRMLLLLDHADVLARSGPELVELCARHGALVMLLETAPQVRAAGVAVVPVGPLDPTAGEELFRRAAASVAVTVGHGSDTAPSIARICSAVGGNPLAIELAARRLPVLPLSRLADLLETPEGALSVLTMPGAASGDDAGTNIAGRGRATSAEAQQLLGLLSVFSGPVTIEAIEAVSSGQLASCYDPLGELLDERLVDLDQAAGHARYRLSSLVRGFASQRLASYGAAEDARARRDAYYAGVARRASVAFDDADEERAQQILGEDYAEAVAAARELAETDPDAALRLAADLGWAAIQRGDGGVVELLGELTDRAEERDPAARRDALLWLVRTASWSPLVGDRSTFIQGQLEDAVGLARRLAEPLPLLRALRTRFLADVGLGAMGAAMESCLEGVRLAADIGHVRWLGRFEISLGAMHAVFRQYDEGARLATSGLDRATRADDRQGMALGSLALHAMPAEHVEHRSELPPLETVLDIFHRHGDLANEMHALAILAQEAIDRGEPRRAAGWILARQQRLGRVDLLNGLTVSVMLGVHVSRLKGDDAEAALLHGTVAAHAEPLMAIISPAHATLYRNGLDTARASLGEAEFDARVARGPRAGPRSPGR